MTPKQKILHAIILLALEQEYFGVEALKEFDGITEENVEEIYDELDDLYYISDIKSEFRSGQVETTIAAPYSRHYECDSVAAKMPDGSWVGWAYWYGGGKHGEPEEVPWMEYAYDLKCVEEEKLVIVRTFERIQ